MTFLAGVLGMLAAGCGGTIRGVSKDAIRIVNGVRSVFFSEEAKPQEKDEKPSLSDFFKVSKSKAKGKR